MSDHAVYLGLGANLGHPAAQLRAAIDRLAALGEVEVVSSLYGSEPEGGAAQPEYRNAALRLRTPLSPEALLDAVLAVESEFGRVRSVRNASRTLDIDILAYDDRVISTERLSIPHPRMPRRAFVLLPLAEIAPEWRHPELGSSPGEMLAEAEGCEGVARLEWEDEVASDRAGKEMK